LARRKTLFLYNLTRTNQEWTVYAEGVINDRYTVGQMRKSFTLSFSGDTTIQFGVDDAVYLKAAYTYSSDSWTSHTDTPDDITFADMGSGVSVSSSFTPAEVQLA
jgi:hypothetical protein